MRLSYRPDDNRRLDFYGKNMCTLTEEDLRYNDARMAKQPPSDLYSAHMNKAVADLNHYITGEKDESRSSRHLRRSIRR